MMLIVLRKEVPFYACVLSGKMRWRCKYLVNQSIKPNHKVNLTTWLKEEADLLH